MFGRMLAQYETDAAQTIEGTFEVVNYDTANSDPYGLVTTGAAWKFTSIWNGYYYITASLMFTSAAWLAGERGVLAVYLDGSVAAYIDRCNVQTNNTFYMFLGGNYLAYIPSGSYIDIRVSHDNGSSINLSSNAYYNQVSIFHAGYYV